MAYIKTLKDNELIGGTDTTEVYPVSSTQAIYSHYEDPDTHEIKVRMSKINPQEPEKLEERIEGIEGKIIGQSVLAKGTGDNSVILPDVGNVASADNSMAVGQETKATSQNSFAEGYGTNAVGGASHAEGWYTKAAGAASHSEGESTTAAGRGSHAEGRYTYIGSEGGHVEGKYNYSSSDIHVVGIGTGPGTSQKDAEVITANGSKYLIGVGGYQGRETTGKKTVQQVINEHDTSIQNLEATVQDECIDSIDLINGKIPAQASFSNQLADKAFVNSSIATGTGTFKGTFNNVSDLPATAENNDYAFVLVVRQDVPNYDRYKYTVNNNTGSWVFEYTLNNSSFTADQWEAINSGITDTQVAKLDALPTAAMLENSFNAVNGRIDDLHVSDLASDIDALNSEIGEIEEKIPQEASSINQLADKAYVATAVAPLTNVPVERGTGQGSLVHKNNSNNNTASDIDAVALGHSANATGLYSFAAGFNVVASGQISHAEGGDVEASGEYSHAEGDTTKALGISSHVEGSNTATIGESSHAEGTSSNPTPETLTKNSNAYTVANARAEDAFSASVGMASHIEGKDCLSGGACSHAEGEKTNAIGQCSHTEGFSSRVLPRNTTASNVNEFWNAAKFNCAWGIGSHAEGLNCLAQGNYSHAEGSENQAVGEASHAGGRCTSAFNNYETAFGCFNVSHYGSKVTLFSVGNGTNNSNAKNALELLQNGALYLQNIGNYNGTNPAAAQSVQEVINGAYTYVNNQIAPLVGYSLVLNEGGTPFECFISTLSNASPSDLNDTEFLPFILSIAKNEVRPRLVIKTEGSTDYTSEEVNYRVVYSMIPSPDFHVVFDFASPMGDTVTIEEESFKVVRVEVSLIDDQITEVTVTGVQ